MTDPRTSIKGAAIFSAAPDNFHEIPIGDKPAELPQEGLAKYLYQFHIVIGFNGLSAGIAELHWI